MSFFLASDDVNIVSSYGKIYHFFDDFFSLPPLPHAAMYLLTYPSLRNSRRPKASYFTRPVSVGIDFVTPDGMVVPRALGEAALLNRTAVLVGGLLVGMWPNS